MLHLANKIRGAAIRAIDGDIGTVDDFYFEEDRWTVRYLLVDTGKWLSGRKVLVSPMSIHGSWSPAGVTVGLMREQVERSPEIDHGRPLSRDTETILLGYYGIPPYWGAAGIWGTFDNPGALIAAHAAAMQRAGDSGGGVDVEARGLQSARRITGYHLHAADGEIGHVDDFLIGDQSWRIRYLLVDTSNWIGGKSVIVSPDAIESIDRDRERLHLRVSRDAIQNGPSFATVDAAVGPGEVGPQFFMF